MAARQPRNGRKATTDDTANDLSYAEARTALDLVLAQLQATDLDVEAMAGLFQRAQRYVQRCETLLAETEQQVLLWDNSDAGSAPVPYTPET